MNKLYSVQISNGEVGNEWDHVTYIVTAPDAETARKMALKAGKSAGWISSFGSIVEVPWPDRNKTEVLW